MENLDEIESKFLVKKLTNEMKKSAYAVKVIKQAYIGEGEHFVQRVRLSEVYNSYNDFLAGICASKEAFLTIKEKIGGKKRFEEEKAISLVSAEFMIGKETLSIEKIRFCIGQKEEYLKSSIPKNVHPDFWIGTRTIKQNGDEVVLKTLTWEVDEFEGNNSGLVLAEMEVHWEEQSFYEPDWVGKNVTEELRYYNFDLLNNPYQNWKDSI
jgi:CYTH domain-containing protein